MHRIPEPELMEATAQARAYAQADFSEPHNHFIELLRQHIGHELEDTVLDLGCGPGDICQRLARACPRCSIHALDASAAMLQIARRNAQRHALQARIRYIEGYLPGAQLPHACYSTIISNSLLHHLKDPSTLWDSIKHFASPDARIFVMDLMRPDNREQAHALVEKYAADEPAVLKQDFFNSLLAAYRVEEIRQQLSSAGLTGLRVNVVSDRHLIVHGRLEDERQLARPQRGHTP